MRFLSPTDQKCAESSTYWQFFYYRPPGKFRFTHPGEIVKMLSGYAKNSIYIYIYDALDNLCEFSTWDWLHHFSQFLFMKSLKKKMYFKIFKSWQVCDWLAKWIIMLRFMDLRWPRVFRRSNAGLVTKSTPIIEYIRKMQYKLKCQAFFYVRYIPSYPRGNWQQHL